MDCDSARAFIADDVLGERTTEESHDVVAHVATCAACRLYQADMQRIWFDLLSLPTPVPEAAALARLQTMLRSHAMPTARMVPVRSWPLRALPWAASVLIASLAGFGVGRAAVDRFSSASTAGRVLQRPLRAVADSSPQFLMLLYDRAGGDNSTVEQAIKTIAEYSAWANGLALTGHLVRAEKLSDAPSEWYGGAALATGNQRIGGFFLIRAADINEARRITQTCPHVKHGGRVELRPIHPT